MSQSLALWAGLIAVVVPMLIIDLVLFGRRDPQGVTMREALVWSAAWLGLGLGFSIVVWWLAGMQRAGEYVAGYLIERSLSIDNLFVFALIFAWFEVPARHRQRVLLWGVVGALILRAVLIYVGVVLIDNFQATLYVFGALLLVMAVRIGRNRESEVHPERSVALAVLRRVMPVAPDYDGQRLTTRVDGRLVATALVPVLVVIATTDLVFAIDSIPAIFAITTDPFIVLTANIFAMLGLRALYFLLEGMLERFVHLQLGLAFILGFVGAKMLAADVVHVPVWGSLLVIVAVLATTVMTSLRADRHPSGTARPVRRAAGLRGESPAPTSNQREHGALP